MEHLAGGDVLRYGSELGVDPGRADRLGWYELLDKLRETHEALGASDDETVLVGEGVGAMYARSFAASRPGSVAALLLVEPTHEAMPELLRSAMPGEDWEDWMARRRLPNEDGIRQVALAERVLQVAFGS